MTTITDIAAGLLLLSGAFIALVAAIGLLRLPDAFTRMHAASKGGVAGSGLALAAIAIHADETSIVVKSLATLAFLLMTTPVAAHLLAKAALKAGMKPRLLDGDRESSPD